jgi:hypothetical protein
MRLPAITFYQHRPYNTYLLYSIYKRFNFTFPDMLNEGIGGFLRSLATAFIVVFIAGWPEKTYEVENLRWHICSTKPN